MIFLRSIRKIDIEKIVRAKVFDFLISNHIEISIIILKKFTCDSQGIRPFTPHRSAFHVPLAVFPLKCVTIFGMAWPTFI